MNETPSFTIKQLLMPNGKNKYGRRVWGLDLETVLLPFFHVSNIEGYTVIPAEALGAPIRLSKDKDGAVKFSSKGRPLTYVVKEISQPTMLMRDNFIAHLQSHTHQVIESNKEQYKISVTTAIKAGKPILDKDKTELDKAVKAQIERAIAEAEAEAEAKAKAEAEAEAKAKAETKSKQAVTA